MLETHLLNSIVALIRQRIADTEAIYLFGSYSRSEERNESDIDLALVSSHKPSPENVFQLKSDLSYLCRKEGLPGRY